MRNKVALALLVLAASIVVTACGGTQEPRTRRSSTPTTPMPANGRRGTTDPRKSCDAQGVNSTQLRTGACTEDGVQYVVANYGGVVQAENARRDDHRTSGPPASPPATAARVAPSATRSCASRCRSRTATRCRTASASGRRCSASAPTTTSSAREVERRVHPESLAIVNGGLIGPGETLRGDVMFDITRGRLRRARRDRAASSYGTSATKRPRGSREAPASSARSGCTPANDAAHDRADASWTRAGTLG